MPNRLASDLEHVLTQTGSLWESLRGQQVFITGGTGFFGTWLLESFLWANERLELGATIHVLTRNPSAFRAKASHLADSRAVRLHWGDVTSFTFPEGEYALLIHAATEASAHLNEHDPLRMFDTVTLGTRRALDFAVKMGIPRVLFTSSGAVYGRQPHDLLHVGEDYKGAPDPLDTRSAYGLGKRQAEHLCAVYAQRFGLHVAIARCFAFVGPYLPLDRHFAVGNFIRDGLAGGPIRVGGDGTPWRSYLYAADLAIWLWTLALRGESCRPYNVGAENALTVRDLAHRVAETFDPAPSVHVAREPQQGAPAERYVPSTRRVADELGLVPTVDLAEALRRTIAWHRETAAITQG